ncbi:Uma2 family endonuclease [uncultured Thiocystis sp.]|jgi:Uma2 family endonuclease|uniref:Uma2 family endonuclease n=1 Tax=uncultured Thiocystis sp. TaxID=1202134 RepID=UPI0025E0AE1E|nr:Uma2 family endonuclease [uncultured Thiocystis sp.]
MYAQPEALPRMTADEYLAFEREQPIRHELVDGYLYAMTGASDRHEEIALNLASALRVHLKGSPCRVYKGDLKIRVANEFYYPDIFVRDSEQRGDADFKTDPIMIAEVLSPGTQRHDRGDKRLADSQLPTLRDSLLIAQGRMLVEIYTPGDFQHCRRLEQPDDLLCLDAIGFSMSLADLYEKGHKDITASRPRIPPHCVPRARTPRRSDGLAGPRHGICQHSRDP